MNSTEKRKDAAHTLCVEYNATPADVNAAYRRRLEQRIHFSNRDNDGDILLYDAKELMQYSPAGQWRAELKLAVTPKFHKIANLIVDLTDIYGRTLGDGPIAQVIRADLLDTARSFRRKSTWYVATMSYMLTSWIGTTTYLACANEPNPTFCLIGGGSTLAASICSYILGAAARRNSAMILTKMQELCDILNADNEKSAARMADQVKTR